MLSMTLEMILEEIREMPVRERKRLISLIVDTLPEQGDVATPTKRNILEFEGVGAEMWAGVDATTYLNQLRDEWDTTS
jgi:hypothetical protein